MPARLQANTLAALALGAAATLGHAQAVPPDYGHDFVTIGAPGNRGVLPSEAPDWDFGRFGTYGDVSYEYRIARTEVTNTQYLEFLNIYTKIPGRATARGIAGSGIGSDGFDPMGNPILFIYPGAEHAPADPTWEFAARYTNWLHNGKGTRLEDFETGVYDTSTFGIDPVTGKSTAQLERSPGSRYFLPTLDEWIKAAHYDPDRHGPGDEGYWLYPGASDDPLVSGLPGEPGAETGAGQDPDVYFLSFPVGSYPDTNAPWGVLDMSGGMSEWTETVPNPDGVTRGRAVLGSNTVSPFGTILNDRLDYLDASLTGRHGFRVGSVVPAPGVGPAMLAGSVVTMTRRRRS